MSNTLLVG